MTRSSPESRSAETLAERIVPPLKGSSIFGLPMRVEAPAARTIPAIIRR
jgi:hypothetical protein